MVLQGKGAAPGAAAGSIFIYNEKFKIPAENIVSSGEEQSHLDRYLLIKNEAIVELESIRLSIQKVDPAKAQIFDAHKEIVEDIIINEEIPARILNEHWAGDWAIYQVYETVLGVLRKTPDPLVAERAADFDDVRARLLKLWYGQKTSSLSALKEPVIVAARDLKPSDTAGMDREKVLAILTEQGGITSHTAIIAKSYGIPAVLGIDGLLETVKQGQLAAVDAKKGTVILSPDDDTVNEYIKKGAAFYKDKKETEVFRNMEGRTFCREKIDIGLNISGLNDDEIKAESYTDFTGLFRTEFLFMQKESLPSEEEQVAAYKTILKTYGKKPVYIRTIDIGGDKEIPGIVFKREKNPFLGNRGIRFCFSNPEIFKTQIRAVLRASVFGNLWLMLPMISSVEDIRKAKNIIAEVHSDLIKNNIKVNEYKIGIMIEIPGIAFAADLAVKEVDFASIGSNDLCQYLCAADRLNGSVENYYNQYHPGMFRLIKNIVTAFKEAQKPLSICGELGGDINALPLLIGLGLRKLSMGAASVAAAKRAIAGITVKKAEELAEKALELSCAEDIRDLITKNN
ncbi:MAG: phosphoenolpyruvate--protein phosphotransferase [Treponema sp.]|nr:phosphoenolpyruvate--protein phosphotransferase [Treponema sp.]